MIQKELPFKLQATKFLNLKNSIFKTWIENTIFFYNTCGIESQSKLNQKTFYFNGTGLIFLSQYFFVTLCGDKLSAIVFLASIWHECDLEKEF